MLTKKQVSMLNAFLGNIFKEYSYKEIKKLSGEKSNSALQNAIAAFKKDELIQERKIGTSILYTLNTDNDKLYLYLSLVSPEILPKKALESIARLKNELNKYTLFYSLVIFGSYASGEYTKKSDLDIAIITQDKSKEKYVKIALNSVNNKSLIQIDWHLITPEEFLEMLKTDYENLGKQIARKNLPLHNINIFYRILKKGVENGFKN